MTLKSYTWTNFLYKINYKVTMLKLTNAVQISINYTIGIRYKGTNWPGTCSIANKKEIIGGSRKKIFK